MYNLFRLKAKETSQTLFNLKGIRYLFSGGISASVDIILFKFFFDIVFHKTSLSLYGMTLEPYSLALLISYVAGSFTSFFLNKYFVFGMQNQGIKQFIKALPVYFFAFLGNWILLKIFIEKYHISPLLSRIIAALLVAIITFNLHKYFTFKPKYS